MPRQANPRNRGLKGNDLDRYKYNWLLGQGMTPSEAQEYRRASWPKIDQAIKLKKQGYELSKKEYYKRKTETKKKPKKEVKERAKKKIKEIYPRDQYPEAPPGYHYAYYKKTGKYVLRKNPTREKIGARAFIEQLIFIKDQTDDVGAGDYMQMQAEHMQLDNNELKDLIIEWLHKEPYEGAIGRVRTFLYTSPEEKEAFIRENSSWALILSGRGSYHEILAALATIAQGVYENERKQEYAQQIIYQVEEYSPRIYKKLAADNLI